LLLARGCVRRGRVRRVRRPCVFLLHLLHRRHGSGGCRVGLLHFLVMVLVLRRSIGSLSGLAPDEYAGY